MRFAWTSVYILSMAVSAAFIAWAADPSHYNGGLMFMFLVTFAVSLILFMVSFVEDSLKKEVKK